MKAPASIIFIVYLFYQVSRVSGVCPEGQLEHGDKCCKPVTHCPSGSYVKTCERNGSCDKCLPCPSGTGNLFITSSFDVKRCHKDNCPTGSFRTSEDKCECAFHDGYIETEDKMSCRQINRQKIGRGCQPGLELNFRGRCETCADDHYKYWNGQGYCVKQMDCSKIRLSKIPGNHTIPATCLGFNDTCSPEERFPPLPPGWKPRGSPIPFVQGTTRRPILWAKITTKPRLLQTTHIINPKKTSQETTSNETYEGAAYSPGTVHACIAVICVLFIITIILIAYIVRIKLQSRTKQKRHDNSYQEIDYSQKVSPNDTQRPLPKKPSSNSLIDTYMEMGKSSNTLKRPVPYIISSPYDPSTLTRLIQPPGGGIPLLPPVYQQNIESIMGFRHCSPPRQENSASGEEEYNALSLVSYPSLRDCSMSSETALKVPDTAEPSPNRVQPANVTEAARVEPARVHPLRGDFGPAYQDAISIYTNSNYSPPLHDIQQTQATQTGIVHPQFVHYDHPMNKTRNREYM